MKKLIRLTESDLHNIIKESVRKILSETKYKTPKGGFDVAAYLYDDALENSDSLEDYDNKMRDRQGYLDDSARNGLAYHPQSTSRYDKLGGSVPSFMYANYPSYDAEGRAKWRKQQLGV